MYSTTIAGTRYAFTELRQLLAAATSERSGDVLAGIGAGSLQQRVAARYILADLPLTIFLSETVVPYEADEITRLIIDSHDREAFAPVAHMTVGQWREWLLSDSVDGSALRQLAPGLTPEMVAAVSKLMRNQDLITVARKCRVISAFRNTLGLPGRLSVRIQPNHPTDDFRGIAASIVDGLLLGCGDAVIGINPVSDRVETQILLLQRIDELREHYAIPTQSCVLSHISNTIEAIERHAPVDLVFQSIAGTEAANRSFGVDLAILREGQQAALSLRRHSIGTNVMYFETGQGSALSTNAHHGVD